MQVASRSMVFALLFSWGGALPIAAGRHEDAMRDPNDSRDICPKIGSPLWLYMASVITLGASVLAVAMVHPSVSGLPQLLSQPLLWVIAGLALLGELRPIVTPGKSRPDSGTAAVTFCFAALLYWGFPVAALLRAVVTLIAAVARRRPVFRTA